MRDERFDTVQPKAYLIDNCCWQHFRSYHGVRGVRIEEITPRTRLGDWSGEEPPDWLLNQDIRRWGLLERPRPPGLAAGGWAATIATWFAPGIADADTLADWLRLAAAATDFPVEGNLEPVEQWFRDSLLAVAGRSIAEKDVLDRLVANAVGAVEHLRPDHQPPHRTKPPPDATDPLPLPSL